MRITNYGWKIVKLPSGPLNKITDVKGVAVGHSTINDGSVNTGVTAIHPHGGNIFMSKVVGATYVMNGYGKTIVLITYMLEQNEQIGSTTGTVNPIVGECNDMFLNDIRLQAVKQKHVYEALSSATIDFEEGAIGAGTGMKCFGVKGGIGSASRVLCYSYGTHTLGVLVLSNFGELEHFQMKDIDKAGVKIKATLDQINEGDKGSVIIVIVTDLPVESRQLKRIIKRACVGLSRTGSYIGNGSGTRHLLL